MPDRTLNPQPYVKPAVQRFGTFRHITRLLPGAPAGAGHDLIELLQANGGEEGREFGLQHRPTHALFQGSR